MTEYNISLRQYNTFALNIIAKKLIHIGNEQELEALPHNDEMVVMGGGSNIVFAEERIEKPVLHIENKGIEVVEESKDYIVVEIAAGEKWADVVLFCSEHWWCGIENLAAIYGTAGAAPVQNIGAYGVEVKDYVVSVLVYDVLNGQYKTYDNKECNFAYRYSRFKYQNKNEIIWKVRLKLHKQFIPVLSYKAIAQEIEKQSQKVFSPLDMCKLVTAIRNSKLPNPERLPNVGSFFKNPVVSAEQFVALQAAYPDLPYFNADNIEAKKLSAAWLIEKTGWKGKKLGTVAMSDTQALVMVALQQAKGSDIMLLADTIMADVEAQFNIKLEIEAHIIR